jgi:hypothetical protein
LEPWTGGIARASLNHRLQAYIPPGCYVNAHARLADRKTNQPKNKIETTDGTENTDLERLEENGNLTLQV